MKRALEATLEDLGKTTFEGFKLLKQDLAPIYHSVDNLAKKIGIEDTNKFLKRTQHVVESSIPSTIVATATTNAVGFATSDELTLTLSAITSGFTSGLIYYGIRDYKDKIDNGIPREDAKSLTYQHISKALPKIIPILGALHLLRGYSQNEILENVNAQYNWDQIEFYTTKTKSVVVPWLQVTPPFALLFSYVLEKSEKTSSQN